MKKIKQITSMTIIVVMLVSIILMLVNSYSYASQIGEYTGLDESRYPGIKQAIQELKSKHPNWNFKIMYTGLDWADVITNEYSGHRQYAKNQVGYASNYKGDWICPLCRDYSKAGWYHASLIAIEYMMDPRNSLDDVSVFQFEELTNGGYDENAINSMVAGTFLQGHTSEIIDATNQTGINPYYVVAKMLQEQGKGGSPLSSGELGYYNPFNIGAAGSTSGEDIANGLAYARNKGWDTLTKGIVGGTNFIASNYINRGQNTDYLQKFDVDDSDGRLYSNQYMQNIMGAENEGRIMRTTYINSGIYEASHTFIIPVYENMPYAKVSRPSTEDTDANVTTITTKKDLVKISSISNLRIRSSQTGDTIDWISPGQIVTRLEKASTKVNGTYWDKIRTDSGVEGFIARETYEYESVYKLYLVPVN